VARKPFVLALLVSLLAAPALIAETAESQNGPVAGFHADGRFVARNITLRSLIALAYGEARPLSVFQISGGPDWINSESFDLDVEASTAIPEAAGDAKPSITERSLLQTLLADRFKLAAHREARDVLLFALVVARRDGRTGPGFRRSSDGECADSSDDGATLPRCGVQRLQGRGNTVRIVATGATMDEVAASLEPAPLGRMVVNRTGLEGRYSFDVEFSAERFPRSGSLTTLTSGSSIFAVLGELGLKLQVQRDPVDVLVVDRAARPSEGSRRTS